jgi:hypothetical protein
MLTWEQVIPSITIFIDASRLTPVIVITVPPILGPNVGENAEITPVTD